MANVVEITLKVNKTGDGFAVTQKGLTGIGKDLDKSGRKAQKFGATMMQATGKTYAGLQRVGRSLTSLPSLITAAGAGILAKSFLGVGISADSMRTALSSALGGLEAATEAEKFLREESDRLGLSFTAQIRGFTGLAAAARGTNLEGEATREIFLGIAEASAALKLTSAESEGALRAINQIMSKGKVQAEELRGQLGERLPGAYQIAAKAMGMTTEQLSKQLELGNLYADDFLPKFSRALREHYSGGMATATKSAQSEMNRMGNSWFDLRDKIMKAGFTEEIAKQVRGITAEIDGWIKANDELIKQKVPEYVNNIKTSISSLATTINTLGTSNTAYGLIGASLFGMEAGAMIYAMATLNTFLNKTGNSLSSVAQDARDFSTAMGNLWDAFAGFREVNTGLKIITKSFSDMGEVGDDIANVYEEITEKINENTAAVINNNKAVVGSSGLSLEPAGIPGAFDWDKEMSGVLNPGELSLNLEYGVVFDDIVYKAKESTEEVSAYWGNMNEAMASSFETGFANLFIDGINGVEDAFNQFIDMMVESWARAMAKMATDAMIAGFAESSGGFLRTAIGSIGEFFTTSKAVVPVAHSGWVVGSGPPPSYTNVNPAIFNNAPRLHDGLAPDEFPAILQRGEEVIPKGGNSGGTVQVNVYNSADGSKAKVSEPRQGKDGMSVDIIIEQIDTAMSDRVAQGRGQFQKTLTKTYGLNRAVGGFR